MGSCNCIHDDDDDREALLGNKRGKSVRFSSANQMEVDPSDLENGQILQLQQRIIEGIERNRQVMNNEDSRGSLDQDTNLDHLSDAIRRQRELGLLIGDELDTHAQLIDETHEMVDRTDARLQKARKKLNYVGRKVKDNRKQNTDLGCLFIWLTTRLFIGSICIVIVLIFVFFVLLALFR